MRRKIVGSSWKMHINSLEEGRSLAKDIAEGVKEIEGVDFFLLPTFPMIPLVAETLKGTSVKWGAQNMAFEAQGALTGEVPPLVLKELGCTYVELGHAERRAHFNEDNFTVAKKVKLALAHGLRPIVCTGETAVDKAQGVGLVRLTTEVLWALDGLTQEDRKRVILAYEPIWAIGQANPAEASYVEEIHGKLRERIAREYGQETAQEIHILYGGSVGPENALELVRQENVDGLFVGRFGLKGENFKKIAQAAASTL